MLQLQTMKAHLRRLGSSTEVGLLFVICLLGIALTVLGGSHPDRQTGALVNNFLNTDTLLQVATESSFFAIMAVGMAGVIISGGIDLSVGSIYALAGVGSALTCQHFHLTGTPAALLLIASGSAIGLLCGLANGGLITLLQVHPFIITLGAMLIYRGIAFVTSQANSILLPESFSALCKSSLGLSGGLHPVPLLLMLLVGLAGSIVLEKTVLGRRIFAVGGNSTAAFYSGVPVQKTLIAVYVLCGFTAAVSALLGAGQFGATSCKDADGYELYVIASAVVGGVSLSGGKGSAWGAVLGAVLIGIIRQAIRTLHLDTNYEWIIIGSAIIIAVMLDRFGRWLASRSVEN